ncbi:MAG: hypothetical protein RIF33_02375 [Cyclobacteriaceae bacterium]
MKILCLLLVYTFQSDTTEISTTDLLQTAFQDTEVKYQESQIDYLNNNPLTTPLIDEVQFRTETRDFDWERQQYALRVSPNSIGQKKYSKAYYQNMRSEFDTRWSEALNKALKDRYLLLIDLIKAQRYLVAQQQQQLVLEDRITVLKKNATAVGFNYQDLIDAENNYQKSLLDMIDLTQDEARYQQQAGEMLGTTESLVIDGQGLIDVSYITNWLATLPSLADSTNINLRRNQNNLRQIELEYLEERAQSKNVLDFVQAEYRNDEREGVIEDFRIGVGLNLPVTKSSQSKLNRLSLERLEQENDLQTYKLNLQRELDASRSKLEVLIKKYETVNAFIESSDTENSLQKYLSIEGISPLTLLGVQESIIDSELRLYSLEKDIFQEYINLLDKMGLLVERPLKNYLNEQGASLE